MSTCSLNQLPPEVLYIIVHYLDITDIVRIRKLSRYLNQVSRGLRHIWGDAYRKADFIRPPGPFPLQSAHYLERAFVTSYRLDRSLRLIGGTDQTERPTFQAMEIRYTGTYLGVSLVFGRFLLIAFKWEVRCYDSDRYVFDTNSSASASIIHRSTGGSITSFYCVSSIDVEGRPFACVVLSEDMQTARRISVYLVHVEEQSEVTLDLLHQFEHPTFDLDAVNLGPRVIIIQGRTTTGIDPSPDRQLVLLDVHTRTQFLLPLLNQAMWEISQLPESNDIDCIRPTVISTSTHILLVKSICIINTGVAVWKAFFLAFALPPLDTCHHFTSSPTTLSLSHRSSFPCINVNGIVPLRDAVLDSSTQDILITFRMHGLEASGMLSLNATRTRMPQDHDSKVGTISLTLRGPVSYSKPRFLHPSVNGTGRVFYMADTDAHVLSASEFDLRALVDGKDAEHPAKLVEYKSVLQFQGPRSLLDYDPYTGRVCLGRDTTKDKAIEVWDFAV